MGETEEVKDDSADNDGELQIEEKMNHNLVLLNLSSCFSWTELICSWIQIKYWILFAHHGKVLTCGVHIWIRTQYLVMNIYRRSLWRLISYHEQSIYQEMNFYEPHRHLLALFHKKTEKTLQLPAFLLNNEQTFLSLISEIYVIDIWNICHWYLKKKSLIAQIKAFILGTEIFIWINILYHIWKLISNIDVTWLSSTF